MSPKPKPPPPPGSVWARIEEARILLGWGEGELSKNALLSRTHYASIGARGWNAEAHTYDKLIVALVENGLSETWLRAGVLPIMSDGKPLPEAPRRSAQLRELARKLALKPEQVMALWADLEAEGPLEKFTDECQRAAFAAAYLEGRTLEDVRTAVQRAQRSESWIKGKGVDHFLAEIRFALRTVKAASGTRMQLTIVGDDK